MGIFKPGAGLAVIAAVGAVMLSPQSPLHEDAAGAAHDGERYRVFDTGRDTGCEIARAPVGGDAPTMLTLGGACAGEASMSVVRYWVDRDDGTVELSDSTGTVAMRLASSDGAAFEAFGDGAPLIMLVDANEAIGNRQ